MIDLTPLLSKGLFFFLTLQYCIGFAIYQHESPKESSPAPQIKSINFSLLILLYGPTLTPLHDYWKKHSFDYTDLCQQSDVSAF